MDNPRHRQHWIQVTEQRQSNSTTLKTEEHDAPKNRGSTQVLTKGQESEIVS
jgi:hypothetical protein